MWLSMVVGGWTVLVSHASSSSPLATPPQRWPIACDIARSSARPTLLVFAHPHCPCTRATLGELERIATRCSERLDIVVSFLASAELGEGWSHGELWQRASAIPGAAVRDDLGGQRARTFGALTSGQTLLFDARGELVFNGGITAARGHAGDNAGERAVIAHAHDLAPQGPSTPVFGCSLF